MGVVAARPDGASADGEPGDGLIGRSRELGALVGLLERTRDDGGRFVTVSGPAGIGKSRLLAEFLRVAGRTATVRSVACSSSTAPLAPWRELVGAELDGGPAALEGRPADVAERVLAGLAALAAPVVLALDDAHLADEASRTLLARVVGGIAAAPVLVLGVLRVPRTGPPASVPLPLASVDLGIGGLGAADVTRLVLAARPELEGERLGRAVESVMASTGGNPLRVGTLLALDGDVGRALVDGEGVADPDAPVREAIARLPDASREVLAAAALAGDLPVDRFGRHAGVDPAALDAALDEAERLGLVGGGRSRGRALHPRAAELLLERLAPRERARRHAVLGRALAADAAVDPTVVAHHLLAAGDEAPPAEVASAALRGGLAALAQHAYADADRLLDAAGQRVPDAAGAGKVRLTLQLGRVRARRGLGDLAGSSGLAAAAARLAEALGDADAFAEAAVLRAYPPDWHDDDAEARGLLARADRAPTGPVWRARVRASRARIEMRSPAGRDARGQVWSWETHPTVARSMADEAVELARTSGDPESLVVALLAWRSNHRAPGFLALRRRASDEAVRIAGRLGDAALLHEAALRAFTDRLEAGERDGAEEAARLVRRAAEREVEPRLLWRAGCLDVTLAWLDGDLARARVARERVAVIARDERIPGGDQVAAMLLGQELLLGGAFATLIDGLGDDHPSLLHPLGLAGRAMACAGVGDRDGARATLDRLPDPPDPEASLLAVTTFAARAVVAIGDADRARHHLALLDPWRDRAATDSEGIVVPVPVASVTARLRDLTGDVDGAREDRVTARELATRLRAAPEVAITEPLAAGGAAPAASVLSPRQVAVLARLAEGRSNAQIAEELHFGVATISRETSAIYRALGAANRAEAVRAALQRGLLPGR